MNNVCEPHAPVAANDNDTFDVDFTPRPFDLTAQLASLREDRFEFERRPNTCE